MRPLLRWRSATSDDVVGSAPLVDAASSQNFGDHRPNLVSRIPPAINDPQHTSDMIQNWPTSLWFFNGLDGTIFFLGALPLPPTSLVVVLFFRFSAELGSVVFATTFVAQFKTANCPATKSAVNVRTIHISRIAKEEYPAPGTSCEIAPSIWLEPQGLSQLSIVGQDRLNSIAAAVPID